MIAFILLILFSVAKRITTTHRSPLKTRGAPASLGFPVCAEWDRLLNDISTFAASVQVEVDEGEWPADLLQVIEGNAEPRGSSEHEVQPQGVDKVLWKVFEILGSSPRAASRVVPRLFDFLLHDSKSRNRRGRVTISQFVVYFLMRNPKCFEAFDRAVEKSEMKKLFDSVELRS